ncbi:hypothetical protein [Flavobacterium flavigenum]|uniref:hypothetical protein n=1 Tax=Flavobacterium flavigenum TaxID=3003258 RepID=UPI0022AC440D|nr:hypothetical protein [Flavobacterium flavigenum]
MEENILKLLNKIINDIELRPKMFFVNPNYRELSSYLFGYLTCIDNINSTHINNLFSEWLNNRNIKTSLFWTEYILRISANDNEKYAYEILIKEFKLFLKANNADGSDILT